MSGQAKQIGYRDLGVNSGCIGAEAFLYDDGTLEVVDAQFEGDTLGGVVLEHEQVVALVAWLLNEAEMFSG